MTLLNEANLDLHIHGNVDSNISINLKGAVTLRPASEGDAFAIAQLINFYAQQGEMLPRHEDSVQAHLSSFIVAALGQEIVGCAALHLWHDGTAEVRSLAVASQWRGQKWGVVLLKEMMAQAELLRVKMLFALTLRPDFFYRMGFAQLEKSVLKQKEEGDCVRCPFRTDCREIAVALVPGLPGLPELLSFTRLKQVVSKGYCQ